MAMMMLTSIQESLARMGLILRCFLIHWPLPKRGKYVEAWQTLVTAKNGSLIRSISVSILNRTFGCHH